MTNSLGLLLQWGPHGPHNPTGPHGPMGPNGWAGAGGMMPWGAGGTGLGLLWWLVLLALVVAVVAGAYLALSARDSDRRNGDADALTVLRRRYASGEIDDDEFERRRDRLDGEPAS